MNEKPIVTVIIPTYGTPVFLKSSIESVQKQTLTDWELIIVDDNDPNTEARENTNNLIQPFLSDKRIRYVQHEFNKNGAAARNIGLKIANGKYCAFLDSDDEYMPERLAKCVDILETAPSSVGGVYTGCQFVKAGKTYHVEKDMVEGNFLVQTLACTFMFCTGSNIFMRMEVVKDMGGFDESFTRHQDYEFLVRFFEHYSLAAVSEVLVIKNNENFNLPNIDGMIKIKEKYLKKYDNIIQKMSKADQTYIFQSQYIQIAESAVRVKNLVTAKNYYRKAKEYGKIPMKYNLRRIALRVKSIANK